MSIVQTVLGRMVKGIKDFNMIKEGDKVAVGISGGKDSMLLFYLLNQYKKFAGFNFEVVGITLRLGFPDMDFQPVIDWSNENGFEYHTVPTEVYSILKENTDKKGNIQCSLCSKFKKALLIDKARELGCNIVCMGHHLDDGIETLFMNAIYNGFLASFKPKMYLDRTDIMFVRPFAYVYEHEIVSAVQAANVPIVPSTCPMDKNTSRETIKHWIKDMYKKFPTTKSNFKNILFQSDKVSLWEKEEE